MNYHAGKREQGCSKCVAGPQCALPVIRADTVIGRNSGRLLKDVQIRKVNIIAGYLSVQRAAVYAEQAGCLGLVAGSAAQGVNNAFNFIPGFHIR